MAMLVLALILVICSQVAKPLTITVPKKFNGILGKCDLALDAKHKVETGLLQKGKIEDCAKACDGNNDCASFHFTGQLNGGNEGDCVYSSFICIDDSKISQPEDKTTYRVYITKGIVAWMESANRNILAESQRRTFKDQTIFYTEGCCTKDNDKYCAGDRNIEAEEEGTPIKSSTECYSACVKMDTCVSFRIKWTVPDSMDDETGICFTSQHACSFTANNQAGRIIDKGRSEALSYFLVQRLKGAKMSVETKEIDVGTTPETSTKGSGRAAAAILAVALAWSILTLAKMSIV